jgi:hypothetical protein
VRRGMLSSAASGSRLPRAYAFPGVALASARGLVEPRKVAARPRYRVPPRENPLKAAPALL